MGRSERLDQPAFTVEQVAAKCGVSVDTVYRWRRDGVGRGFKLRFFLIGGKSYVLETDLHNWLVLTAGMRDDMPIVTTACSSPERRRDAGQATDGKSASVGS